MRWTEKLYEMVAHKYGEVERFARNLGVPTSTVRKWLTDRGRGRTVRNESAVLPRAAESLDVDLGWLMDEKRGMPPVPRSKSGDVYADMARTAGASELRVVFEALSDPEASVLLVQYAALLLRGRKQGASRPEAGTPAATTPRGPTHPTRGRGRP